MGTTAAPSTYLVTSFDRTRITTTMGSTSLILRLTRPALLAWARATWERAELPMVFAQCLQSIRSASDPDRASRSTWALGLVSMRFSRTLSPLALRRAAQKLSNSFQLNTFATASEFAPALTAAIPRRILAFSSVGDIPSSPSAQETAACISGDSYSPLRNLSILSGERIAMTRIGLACALGGKHYR